MACKAQPIKRRETCLQLNPLGAGTIGVVERAEGAIVANRIRAAKARDKADQILTIAAKHCRGEVQAIAAASAAFNPKVKAGGGFCIERFIAEIREQLEQAGRFEPLAKASAHPPIIRKAIAHIAA